jgi:catecholate siderophore receptor
MLLGVALHLVLTAATAAASGSEVAAGALLHGRVVDTTGAPVSRARVSAVAQGESAGPSTHTDDLGEFVIAAAPGAYDVVVESPGFRPASRRMTARESGGPVADIVLQVATRSETVDVTAPRLPNVEAIRSATKTLTPLRDVPQSVTVTSQEQIKDQLFVSIADVVRYVPGIGTQQGENNRDQIVMRGNSSSADFFLDGVRDDVQYYRDLYNLDRVEALKGPNAMVFGRGGGGGVINRVTKEAIFQPVHEVSLQGGAYGRKRVAGDFDQPLSRAVALRFNGMYEQSDSFRDQVDLSRYALNPTLTIVPGRRTRITLGYEHLHDTRVADRGIPSFQGGPVDVDIATFFGDPEQSHVRAGVDLGSLAVEHRMGRASIRNRTLVGHYDRGYQNFVPGAVTADGLRAALTAYNNATVRDNVFNQTDLTAVVETGAVRHTLLAGLEVGRQASDNFRNTGFFGNTATSISVPLSAPTVSVPVTFRQSATDADNDVRATVAAAYVQDQLEVSSRLHLLGGLRFDRFDLRYRNHRNGDEISRPDDLVSPRAGIVFKPRAAVSLYGSFAVSYLPSSGDQFSSLTSVTEQLEPEKFTNYEVGIKWDVRPRLALTTAVYRLDRTNTRSTDPADPTRIVQTGSQRTDGFELAASGQVTSAWSLVGGYAYQDASVTSATAAAREGAKVAQVPRHTLSLWTSYQFVPRFGAGLGVVRRTDMFAAIDNTVVLPGYTRVDAAAYFALTRHVRLQANVENLLGATYYVNADNNTNISPGFPRAVRVGLTTSF